MKTLYERLTKKTADALREAFDTTPKQNAKVINELLNKSDVTDLSLGACNYLYELIRLKENETSDFRITIFNLFND